ncbi:class F sortase [Amycolatopsis sp. cg9]|uniref:class F sortase n=1 Tax=Amycolatopsis sp. cg9 TaxID=3238801 RepID=UPI0035254576
MANDAGEDWRGEDWFVDEWHRGVGWAAVEDEQHGGASSAAGGDEWHPGTGWAATGDHRRPAAPKPRRGRLLAGFALGASTVLAVQLGSSVVAAPPVAVVAGTALPAAGAAAPKAAPTATQPSTPAAPPPPPPASTPAAAPAGQPSTPGPQQPGTVRLPAGGTATLVRKDLGPGGELPVPDNLGQATWWGAELDAAGGASVFAGHVNWRGATGPFAELWTARIGGAVTVVDSAGKTWRYRISQLLTVHKEDLPAQADDLFGQSGPHRVVLATCGGRWVGGSDGYEENRIVIAESE